MTVFQPSGIIDDHAGLSLFGSILIYIIIVVLVGIGFIAAQKKPEPILPALHVTLVNPPFEEPERIIFSTVQLTRNRDFHSSTRLITR